MRYFLYVLFVVIISETVQALNYDELEQIHKVTTTEMNSISSPRPGSLVYNTTENTLYFYTGTAWKRTTSSGAETIINAGNGMTITGSGTSAVPYTIGVN